MKISVSLRVTGPLLLSCAFATFAGAQAPAHTNLESPSNRGRAALLHYLDGIADQELAARQATIASIHTRAQAEARQREVRATILRLMGGLPERTPLHAKVVGTTQLDGFRIEKILYDSQPNFPVTALFYLPDHPSGKLPAIVMAPGHGPTGKASDFSFASIFARNGFAVLSYDPIGQGERLQYPDPDHPGKSLATRPTGEHGEAGLQPTLIGDAVARFFLWDGMRAVDYLESRPEVDHTRIGAFGCSGGGAMTALLGAMDPRVKAVGTACYITSFDKLLPAIGAQDAEQSIPRFIASGLNFPDWVELAAPRAYAVISTTQDMFPWAGAKASVTEARRFYSLFDPTSAGTPTGNPEPPLPTGPTLNPDTSNSVPPTADLQWITGIGHHGNLRPLQSQIVSFFLVHLAHSSAAPILPPPPPPGRSPFALPPNVPKDALQVTSTGQVSTSFPGCATVHSLTVDQARTLPRVSIREKLDLSGMQRQVRLVTLAVAVPGHSRIAVRPSEQPTAAGNMTRSSFVLPSEAGIDLPFDILAPKTAGPHPAVLLLAPTLPWTPEATPESEAVAHQAESFAASGHVVMVFTPRPSPPGVEETKSPILGPFYLTELRSELVGKTILGMRIDDVIRALDSLSTRPDVDPNLITGEASGHMGLVLLHAAVLDPRLHHISVDHTLASYESLLHAPMPIDAPQDILPGVLRHYDLGDLLHILGPRVTFADPLPGTANLGWPRTGVPTR